MHDANMFGQQGMGQSTRTPTLSPVRAMCTQRETTGRVIIVIVAEREDKREESSEREREKYEGREGKRKERTREREKEKRERGLPLLFQNVSMCRFKTPPCVPAKRAHVFNILGDRPPVLCASRVSLAAHQQETMSRSAPPVGGDSSHLQAHASLAHRIAMGK